MIGIFTMTYDMLDPNGNEVERRFTKKVDIDVVDGIAMMNADISRTAEWIQKKERKKAL